MVWSLFKTRGLPLEPENVTAGSAVTAGQLVVQAGDDGNYDAAGDNATVVSGFALSSAASGDTFNMLPIAPWQVWKATMTGSYAAAKLGSLVSINASQVVDIDDAGNDLLKFLGEFEGSTTVGLFSFISTACTFMGAEV